MDGDLIALDEALYRLLYHRSVRDAFLAGGDLPVSAADAALLAELPQGPLARAAKRVAHDLMRRRQRGSGDLCSLFARTLAGRDEGELSAAFLESAPFAAYREVPVGPPGLSLEEAFYRFCRAAGVGDPVVLEDELWTALLKSLAVNPRPHFTLPPELIVRPGAYVAVAGPPAAPVLYAATGGRFIKGEITPFMADLLRNPGAEAAARHGVSPAVHEATTGELRRLGLIQ